MTLHPEILTYANQHTPAPLRHLISPDATLDELQLGALAPVELALIVEDLTGRDVSDAELEGWRTLADVGVSLGETAA